MVGVLAYLVVVNVLWPDHARDILRLQIVRSLSTM
jgi:hypothetical protein